MADEARILELIIDLLQGTLSAAGKEELDAWANSSPANRLYLENQVTLAAIAEDLQILAEMDERSLDEKVWAGIMAEAAKTPEPAAVAGPTLPVRPGIIKWLIYTGALIASALLAVAGIKVYKNIFSKKTDQKFSAVRTIIWDSTLLVLLQEAKHPVLFIAGNRYILLDSAQEGRLAQQGSLRIVKRRGQIVFIHSRPLTNNTENSTPDSVSYAIGIPLGAAPLEVILPDSSIAGLLPGSILKFKVYHMRHQPPQRLVALVGNATFTVAHNKVPFIVETSQLEMTAKGTKFQVTDTGDKMYSVLQYSGHLSLTDGRVPKELDSAERASPDPTHSAMNIETHVVLPQQKSDQDENFDFSHYNLTNALKELARYYGIPHVQIEESLDTLTPGKLSLGQVPKNLSLDQVLETLEKQTNDMHFSADDDVISVTKQTSSGPDQTR